MPDRALTPPPHPTTPASSPTPDRPGARRARRSRPTRSAVAALLLALAVLLLGCSSDDAAAPADDAAADTTARDTAARDTAARDTAAPDTTTTVPPDPGAIVPPRPSAGCRGGRTDAVSEERVTVTTGGTERWALVTTPPPADPAGPPAPLPLVLDVHGLGEGAEFHARMSGYGELARQEGFVVAFPQGTGSPVGWRAGTGPEGEADVAFMDGLIDTLAAQRCLDLARVYATGLSNGAMLSSVLACVRSERIAAIVAVAGVMRPEPCPQTRPVPVQAYHGTADPILLFNGGIGDLAAVLGGGSVDTAAVPPADLDGDGVPAAMRAWAGADGCGTTPVDTRTGAATTVRSFPCPPGVAVELVVTEGAGHSWPDSDVSRSIERFVGPTTADVDATADGWAFLRRWAIA